MLSLLVARIALLDVLQETAAPHAGGLGTEALIFMVVSMAAVTLLTIWCFYRVLVTHKHFDPDGTGPRHAPVAGEVAGGRSN